MLSYAVNDFHKVYAARKTSTSVFLPNTRDVNNILKTMGMAGAFY